MKPTQPVNSVTWHDLTRLLAVHINWLQQTASPTRESRSKIERWRQQLDALPAPTPTRRAPRGRLL